MLARTGGSRCLVGRMSMVAVVSLEMLSLRQMDPRREPHGRTQGEDDACPGLERGRRKKDRWTRLSLASPGSDEYCLVLTKMTMMKRRRREGWRPPLRSRVCRVRAVK